MHIDIKYSCKIRFINLTQIYNSIMNVKLYRSLYLMVHSTDCTNVEQKLSIKVYFLN